MPLADAFDEPANAAGRSFSSAFAKARLMPAAVASGQLG